MRVTVLLAVIAAPVTVLAGSSAPGVLALALLTVAGAQSRSPSHYRRFHAT